ncbi:MAG: RagB/SusD family nutrient uptake outer membrane protein [Alistipes sp.]|nr:RagB/SusD family nutrient uptake outer membrane protein [Alistipes sp.]
MKRKLIILLAATAIFATGCADFLDSDPNAGFDRDQADDPEGFVTAAYAALSNNRSMAMWAWGDVRSDDAYKGGGGITDGYTEHCFETSSNILTAFGELDGYLFAMYSAISRANSALKALHEVDEADFPLKTVRMAEMRFLRGHFHFMLKIMFKHVPYIDEFLPDEDYNTLSNVALTSDELWAKIAEDFLFAVENLPERHINGNNQYEVGRVNKFAAAAYYAKTMLYKAYRQDERHNVTAIDIADLNQVVDYCDMVIGSGYGLEADFAYNFLPGTYENGIESLFAIQFSIDAGTMFGRLNIADMLSVPQGIGCCDFHKPSQNLVNSYKTASGLPLFDTFDDVEYIVENDPADPRLFSTVAIPGLPYKYNEGLIYATAWNRYPELYSVYASLKENVDPSCDCFINMSPYYANSMNKILLRYADVLLFKAEALIELGREGEAMPLINQVRARARGSANGMVNYANHTMPTDVADYVDGVNCTWDRDFARKALRWERRLEFAMENSRFFDLVRWGEAAEVINSYYESESARRSYYQGMKFEKNRNEYLPIPLNQISYSKGSYKQNYGF